jgi:hypothetical protein
VDLEYNDKDPMNGNTFASKFLEQYFNVVTLWQYHRSHEYSLAESAYIDDLSGNITGAWQYVGNEFDLNVVPSGDRTYPIISMADVLSYNIQQIINGHKCDKFTEFPAIAEQFLIREKGDADVYINGEYVNERNTDQIVPTLPYSIKSEIHYPHPILFVYDDVIGNSDILPETDFHALCREWALEREGAVVTWAEDHLPAIIGDGDVVAYTEGSDSEPIKLLQKLNPGTEFKVKRSDKLLDEITGKE